MKLNEWQFRQAANKDETYGVIPGACATRTFEPNSSW